MNNIWSIYEREAVEQMLSYSFIGSSETMKNKMQDFVNRTEIDEVMVTSHIFDDKEKMRSYALFAEAMKENK